MKILVAAKLRIAIRPRIVPWGASIRIVGRVLGGYVPANSKLLRLNVGIGRIGHIEGLPDIQPNGRFVIVWKFDQGHGVLHPWFSVATLSEAAFPYAPGTSKQVTVTLGEPTPRGRRRSPTITTANTAAERGTSGDDCPSPRRYAQTQPLAPSSASEHCGYDSRTRPLVGDRCEQEVLDQSHATPRRSRALIVLATVISVAVIAGAQRTVGAPRAALSSSPQQWVDQWTAASLRNPAGVCQHLLAPALAAAFKTDAGRTCARFYASVRSSSFRVRHVLEDGPTATVEARPASTRPKSGNLTIVLSHIHGGWQAVDVIPGGSVRPR